MPDINPFSVLKMGNDPSLTQRTVQGSKALADLQRGIVLRSMADKAAGERTAATNKTNLQGRGLQFNLGDVARTGKVTGATTGKLDITRGIDDALKSAEVADRFRGAGIGLLKPETPFKATQFPNLDLIGNLPLKGEAAAAAGKVTGEQGTKRRETSVEVRNGKFVDVVVESFAKQKGETKGPSTAKRAREIIESVQRVLAARGETFRNAKILSVDDKSVTLEIDGRKRTFLFAVE